MTSNQQPFFHQRKLTGLFHLSLREGKEEPGVSWKTPGPLVFRSFERLTREKNHKNGKPAGSLKMNRCKQEEKWGVIDGGI